MPWLNSIGHKVPDPVITAKTGVVIRTPAVRVPIWLVVAGKAGKGAVTVVWLYFRYWWLTAPPTIAAYIGLRYGWPWAIALVLIVGGSLVVWWQLHRASFLRFLGYPYRAKAVRWKVRRRFPRTMMATGLAARLDGQVMLPVVTRVKSQRYFDVVRVRMQTGQIVDDYAKNGLRFATAFGALDVRVAAGSHLQDVELWLMRSDPLAAIVGPLAVPVEPDFTALPIGRMEQGDPFTIPLFGNQLLGVGATGSGKASIAWSFIRAVAGGVLSGRVRLWVFDPKGGLELAGGRDMFDRFLCEDYTEMADTLDQAVAEMRRRTATLRGVTRQHFPTVDEPLTVILIDELAALTAYAERAIKERIKQSLGLILTQGRAVGFHVLALVQDPRKEVLPFRDLFTARIGLRLNEPEQVDLVLGDGARDRGALCDRISQTTPGVGYVVQDGDPTPIRVRIAYLDDREIAEMAATYSRTNAINGRLIPSQPSRDMKAGTAKTPATEWVVNR